MKIEHMILRQIELPLVHFFETSFRRTYSRSAMLLEVRSEGLTAWGECVAGEGPFYSYECIHTAWSILTEYLLPATLKSGWVPGQPQPPIFQQIRGHHMAKAAVESALWDLEAKRRAMPLWKLLGGSRERIAAGVSIGIQDDVETLLDKIDAELDAGYQKIKIKIKKGWDVEIVEEVRKRFPEISLMVDANSAYSLSDADHLGALDAFNLLMIEQPLYYDDFIEHARLQSRLKTPICLDESIRHTRDAAHAIAMEACRIINIKMGRLGGYTESRGVHDLCLAEEIPVWCGGMLETGIGRAHNIALSTLENFTLPGDVSASKRYFERDVVRPGVEVTADGWIEVPQGPGIGFEVDSAWIDENTVRSEVFG